MEKEKTDTNPYSQIYLVFGILVILTIVEFIVAATFNSAVFLLLIGLAKAGLIVQFFMHVYRLWRDEESH